MVDQETRASTTAKLQDLPVKTIARIMSMLIPLRTDKVIGRLLKVSMTVVSLYVEFGRTHTTGHEPKYNYQKSQPET